MKKIAIIGLGLIGGSLGRALLRIRSKGSKYKCKVIGIGRNIEKLRLAKKIHAVDEYTTDIVTGVKKADIVILATPVNTIVPLVKTFFQHIKPSCVISDVGSVKKDITAGIEKSLGTQVQFVGGHPLAGSEKVGVINSRPDLFEGAIVVLCPLSNTKNSALREISSLWRAVGAKPIIMLPEEHDLLISYTSHLPHILSGIFCRVVFNYSKKDSRIKQLLAGSFRDFTRISSSEPSAWAKICQLNRHNIQHTLNQYIAELRKLSQRMSSERVLNNFFISSKLAREKLLA